MNYLSFDFVALALWQDVLGRASLFFFRFSVMIWVASFAFRFCSINTGIAQFTLLFFIDFCTSYVQFLMLFFVGVFCLCIWLCVFGVLVLLLLCFCFISLF